MIIYWSFMRKTYLFLAKNLTGFMFNVAEREMTT